MPPQKSSTLFLLASFRSLICLSQNVSIVNLSDTSQLAYIKENIPVTSKTFCLNHFRILSSLKLIISDRRGKIHEQHRPKLSRARHLQLGLVGGGMALQQQTKSTARPNASSQTDDRRAVGDAQEFPLEKEERGKRESKVKRSWEGVQRYTA